MHIKCPAAHRVRTRLIGQRDMAMKLARELSASGIYSYTTFISDMVRAARHAQHNALKFKRQDK